MVQNQTQWHEESGGGLRSSVFGEYLFGCLREAQSRTVILKEFSCSYWALTMGPVLGGVVPDPVLSPAACAEPGVTGAVVITHKKKKASSLVSGSRRTLFVICWFRGGLKCVKASGNGRKGSA